MRILLLSIFFFSLLYCGSCQTNAEFDRQKAVETLDSIATEGTTFVHPPPRPTNDTLVFNQ